MLLQTRGEVVPQQIIDINLHSLFYFYVRMKKIEYARIRAFFEIIEYV